MNTRVLARIKRLLLLLLASLLMVAPRAHADITSNLVLWWACDDNTGTTVSDSSGNGRTGTLTGNATWLTPGKTGVAACSFDGAGDYVTGTSTTLTTAVTVGAWVNPTTVTSGTSKEIFQTSGDSITLRMEYSTSQHVAGIIQNASSAYVLASSSTALAAATWSHVALTYNGAVVRLYVNGVEANTSGVAQTGNVKTYSTWRIGIHPNGTANPWLGAIDEVRVFARVLTLTEINELMNYTGAAAFTAKRRPILLQ